MDKELDLINSPTQIEKQVEQQQEYKMIGSMRLRRGMRLYSFYPSTGELKETNITHRVSIDMKGEPLKESTVTFDPKAYYIQALNWKNAKKKSDKIMFQLKYLAYVKALQKRQAQKGE